MREALRSRHMGQVIYAYRTHPWHGRTLNQDVVANWLSLSQTRLSRIEKGPPPDELSKLIHWAQTLGVPEKMLWFTLPENAAPFGDKAVARAEPSRRIEGAVPQNEAGSALRAERPHMSSFECRAFPPRVPCVMALPALSLDELEHIAAALDDAHRYLDGSVVDYFRRRLAGCAAADGDHGPRRTLPAVLGLLAAVEHSARQVRPAVRRELLGVGAESAEFAGWLYRDLGAPDLAAYWRDRASEWAQEAGRFAFQGYVLLRKSQAAWDERDGLRMLTLAQAAQEGPWELPVKVRAEAAQQEARGHAMLGDDPDLMERKLDEARALVAETGEPDGPDAQLSARYDASLLSIQSAICFDAAGQPTRAVNLYETELSSTVFSHRDSGYFRALMASSLAAAGEPDEAGAVGLGAFAIARETNSTRTTSELRRVVGRLGPWSTRPAIRELRDALLSA